MELIVLVIDVSVWIDVVELSVKSLLLLQFLSASHETWHTFSMCQYAKNCGRNFDVLIFKLLAIFLNIF